MTRAGWGLLAGSVVLYAGSVATGSPELATVAVAGLLVLVIGGLFLLRRPSLAVERRVEPRRVTVGSLAEGFVTVTNTGRSRSGSVVCQDRVGAARAEVVVPRLGAGRSVTVPYALPTERRAVVTVGPLELVHADPFGLVERRAAYGRSEVLHVHPRVHAVAGPRVGLRVDLDAEATETTRGDATYHALREYVRGDDLRRIHWKASAHVGDLMVREHVDPVRPDTTVVLDTRRAVLDPEAFELAVEVVASLVVAGVDRGFPVALTHTGPEAGGLATHGDRGSALDRLAAVGQHGGADLDLALGRVLSSTSGRSLVVVTGRASAADLARLAASGRRFAEVVVVAVVEAGTEVAAPGRVEVVRVGTAAEFVAAWRRR